MEWIKQDGFPQQIFINKEKVILKMFFIGMQQIRLRQNLSLRYSLWKRDPTNDLRVIRFCLSVPEEQYVQNGLDRSLITKSYRKIFT